ncbi:CAP domain-containing protein [Kitasatospora sp. NPDC091335]|uniref:CAP domain-containing protein n=1 Tax=Kitasatospora sp. NPDC091335 TaxID=3364085 RepID=UPI00380CE094
MNSDDRTTILPASGGGDSGSGARGPAGGRAARRAAERHTGRGRRGRRRGGIVPVAAVVAVVAGTGLFAALAGAGYAAYGGKQTDRDMAGQSLAADALISAELGTREGIQVPGAGGTNPDLPPSGTATATDPAATPSAPATPTAGTGASPTASAAATPAGTPTPTATASAAKASPSATRTAAAAQTTAQTAAQTAAKRAPAGPPAGGGASPSDAQEVVNLVNAERAKAGCGPVSAEPRLASAAQSHSDDMANRNYFDHASPEGEHADHRIEAAGYNWSTWGENIARGQKDPAAVMESWMNSPGHRANILNCSFKQLGVGVRTGANGPWWTQVFAAPA